MPVTVWSLILYLLLGMGLGYGLCYLYFRMRMGRNYLTRAEVEAGYLPRAVYDALQRQTDVLQDNLLEKTDAERELTAALAGEKARLAGVQERLDGQQAELKRLQEESRLHFEALAARLLEEKSQKFTAQNAAQLQGLLDPLREKIKSFEDNIERRFVEETRDRISLKKEIEHLRELNQQLSQDANHLATALKGDTKAQGDWGEWQLELLLERSGLQRDLHFRTQASFTDENGRAKRPDFIINLPDGKHLIIDCKVSLIAYERYCRNEEKSERHRHLQAHLDSLRRHVRDLSGKNYQQLYQINSPDYLLLFVPIEPAFALAAQHDNRIFLDALDNNIVIVTASTLLATMRTVSYIWKQERQKRSVMEIARQSGLLYDKFCSFVEDLQQLGLRLDQAQTSYQGALRKLSEGKRPGDTLIARAERLRELGAQTSKQLPEEFRE
jgi:DNA recombination protein RmuC